MHSRLGSFIISAAVAAALIAPAAASAQDLNVSDASVVEGTGAEIWFDVSRGAPTAGTTYVHFEISPGTALFPADYGQFFDNDGVNDSNLDFDAGVTTLRITVPVVNDSLFEADENLSVTLGPGVVGGTIVDGVAVGTILNDDGAALPTTPPSSTTPVTAPKPKKCKKKGKKRGKKASAAKKCKK